MTLSRINDQPSRDKLVSIRMTEAQAELLNGLAEALECGRTELIRRAIDYWLENSPDSRRAKRQQRRSE